MFIKFQFLIIALILSTYSNNSFAFGCDKKWLHYGARVTLEGAHGPYPRGFLQCYGEWDSDWGSGRTDHNGKDYITVVLCQEDYKKPPLKIKGKCIIKDRFDENPISERITFKRRGKEPNHVFIVPYEK